MDDAAPRRAWIAAPVSSPSGGAPTVAVSALDAPGVSAASSAACAGTRRGVCVFWRLLTAPSSRGASGRPNAPCSPAVRAPPARMRAGRPRTRRNPQVHAFAWGGFWGAPACLRGARASGAHAGGTPAHPAQPSGARPCRSRLVGKPWRAIFRFRQQDAQTPLPPCVGARGWRNLTGGDFWGSPGVPSFVSGSRTPRLPLLPLWVERGGFAGRLSTVSVPPNARADPSVS